MAQSPAHRFGQIIGDLLQAGFEPLLQEFAKKHGLFLDKQGSRPCRVGKKCSWIDLNGNTHDLDFVLERGSAPDKIGTPAAFIEIAWRRYTKHSCNKVQEIQGAIEPLATTFSRVHPFKGAVLAGVFTEGALSQLRSLGFTVLYIPYPSVVAAFRKFGVSAAFDEQTPDADFKKKVAAYGLLSKLQRTRLAKAFFQSHRIEVAGFFASLANSVSRGIERIVVLILRGESHELSSVNDAIQYIEQFQSDGPKGPVERYEIEVRYNNGDAIRGNFHDKADAIQFLKNYQSVDVAQD